MITNYRCPECEKTWDSGEKDGLMDNMVWFELCDDCVKKRNKLQEKIWSIDAKQNVSTEEDS